MDGEQATPNRGDIMITIIWIATGIAVVGSIELVARSAASKRSAVKVSERQARKRHR